jgi:hypothetical protein
MPIFNALERREIQKMVDAAVEQAMLKYAPPATLPAGEQTAGFVSSIDFAESDPAKQEPPEE